PRERDVPAPDQSPGVGSLTTIAFAAAIEDPSRFKRLSPRDIAFIHPGQRATVKITAYDYAIFGGLEGEVVTISPDTIKDEVDPQVYCYRVFIRTQSVALVNDAGTSFPIVPRMIATVD